MARRLFKSSSFTMTAVADTTNFTNQSFLALQGGSSTQMNLLWEVAIGGQATAAGAAIMQLSRDSTVGASLTALSTGESDAAMDPATAALGAPPAPFTAASTVPKRSATLGLHNFSINAYGGFSRWKAYDESDCVKILGNTASLGEVSLSPFTGSASAPVGGHFVYESK